MHTHHSCRVVLLVCVLAGCASTGRQPVTDDGVCTLAGDPLGSEPAAGVPLVVAAAGSVDPAHAPRATNPLERMVFAQLFETLVDVDCAGRVGPALATEWRRDGDSWIFRLREHARFSDGSPVTAHAVAESWTAAPPAYHIESLAAINDRELRVQASAVDDAADFAHSSFAVARRVPRSAWPVGTGAYAIAESVTRAGTLDLVPTGGAARPITVRALPGDARDALDGGVDVLVTDVPLVLDYARTLPQYRAAPLPWSSTYALVVATSDSSASELTPVPAALRVSLASDAVTVSARADTAHARHCPGPHATSAAEVRRIAYARRDLVAGALADRIVALVASRSSDDNGLFLRKLLGTDGRIVSDGVEERMLGRGVNAAWIVAIPPEADPCAALPLPLSSRVIPLVQTRSSVILRRGVSGVRMDGRGTLRLAAPPGAGQRSGA